MGDLPPPVNVTLDQTVREYWRSRTAQHVLDSYHGLGMSKFPEDLKVYEHLLWQARPDAVIELGTHSGGSALWFADQLRNLAHYGGASRPLVVSVDVTTAPAAAGLAALDPDYADRIVLIEADLTDPAVPELVAAALPEDAKCFVVEDSAHTYATTRAALDGFARFVPVDGYFIVEDGCVDVEDLRLDDWWPRGVLPALEAWLETDAGRRFTVRRDLELYGISCHPQGFLQRTQGDPDSR
jgi:cephalosporin hydroxylase